jgi:S-adenosylmethionine hydrolase
MPRKAIITLLTDFGTTDYFVAAMKGVILSAHPDVVLVDISHEIPAHSVATAAFTVLACYCDFPAGTIHLAVVDPGVGSTRRPIAIDAGGYTFVGPDNGLFSHVLDRESHARVFHLTRQDCFRSTSSTTFHGRDIFAPVAARLAGGIAISDLGDEIDDPVRLDFSARCKLSADGAWDAAILHIDRFGNCITNLTRDILPTETANALMIEINGQKISQLHRCYAEAATGAGELFAIWGSAGFLELSAYCDSAAQRLRAARGNAMRVTVQA